MDVTLVSLSGVTVPPGGAVQEAEHSCRPGGAEHGHVHGLPACGECPPRRPPCLKFGSKGPQQECVFATEKPRCSVRCPGVLALTYTSIPSRFLFEMKCIEIIAPHIIF